MNHSTDKKYRVYVLRLWCADALDHCWHASLEDPHTRERIGFATMEQLFAFLMEQVERDAKGGIKASN